MDLETKIQYLKGVGPKMAERLDRLGIKTVSDLIYYFPRDYNDYSQITKIAEIVAPAYGGARNDNYTIRAKIINIANRPTRRRKFTITEAVVADETGSIKVVWFNQPYLEKMLKAGDEVTLAGKISFDNFSHQLQLESPVRVGSQKIAPVYPETAGIRSGYISKLVFSIKYLISDIEEFIPEKILEKHHLLNIREAIKQLHFPENSEQIATGRNRLAFDELFLFALEKQLAKKEILVQRAPAMQIDENFLQDFVAGLPFQLTDAQRKAAWQIIKDVSSDKPMNRLLNGDVGSGKTVVAAFAAAVVIKNNFRVALMAPTEILASQHFQTLKKILAPHGINVALVTSATNRHPRFSRGSTIVDSRLRGNDRVDLYVGTHALLHLKNPIENLGLVIIDEQHRFGVSQRNALLRHPRSSRGSTIAPACRQGMDSRHSTIAHGLSEIEDLRGNDSFRPHFLSMTATPIPRTMSLFVFADLDVSVIDEMPKDRKEIITKVVSPSDRQKAYEFIHREVKAGRQVFVVCPLIEENNKLKIINNNIGISLFEEDKKTVIKESERLQKEIFPDLKIGILHGKMKSKEKEQVMADFKAKKFDILVSTSVVEVGVDIPNATVMMIENAEQFGLAQLHQFRGRVGRSGFQSYCLLFSSSRSENAKKRLSFMESISSGFKLAEMDLELRGPGQMYGKEQSGFWNFRFADIGDKIMIEKTSQAAKNIVGEIEEYSELLAKVGETKKHLE